MASVLAVEWAPGKTVEALIVGSGGMVMVLAHGAGAGPDHPFMIGARDRFAERGLQVVTFPYPYMAEGRRAPDRQQTLLAAHRAVVAHVSRPGVPVVLAGKSMGGRMASHLDDVGAAAFVYLGYPLVPPGKTEPRDTSHLRRLTAPMLFVQGDRDRLAPMPAIRALVGRLPGASLLEVPGADHQFHVLKSTGLTDGDVLDRVADDTTAWLQAQVGGGT
jgi:predicted alpha/beta-hydrolase family hydrolase